MRGGSTGALERNYLHSILTTALWYGVEESERLYTANLLHAVMIAALYGNPSAKLDDGNEQIHEMYMRALNSIPYIGAAAGQGTNSDVDELIEEWKKLNQQAQSEAAKED